MDLILRDANFHKKSFSEKSSIIPSPSFSSSSGLYGASKNDFQLVLPLTAGNIDKGDLITYGTTEFGGKIMERIINTADSTVTYIGKTFRGQMEASIIAPSSVLTLTGTDFELVSTLLELSQLDYKIMPTGRTEQKTVVFPLGTNLLKANDLVLAAFNEKMLLTVTTDGVTAELCPATELKFDASQTDLTVDDNQMLPTALHATGKVNGAVFHTSVYLQVDGSIGTERHYVGMEAFEMWEQLSDDCASESEFISLVSDRLLALRTSTTTSEVDFKVKDADIGDIVSVTVDKFGIKVNQKVVEKTLKIEGKNKEITFVTGG